MKQQLSIKTDKFCTLIDTVGVWGLWRQIHRVIAILHKCLQTTFATIFLKTNISVQICFLCTVYATLTKVRLLICKLTVHGVVGKRYGGVVDVSRAAGEV